MSDETASRDLSPTRETIIQALSTIRQRTLDIVTPISESGLGEQHSPLMSPIVWDLGHIAEFEDLWLVERLGEVVREASLPETFDAMRTPRSRRGELDLPGREAILARLQDVRRSTLDTLSRVDLDGCDGGGNEGVLRPGDEPRQLQDNAGQHGHQATVGNCIKDPRFRRCAHRRLVQRHDGTAWRLTPVPGLHREHRGQLRKSVQAK